MDLMSQNTVPAVLTVPRGVSEVVCIFLPTLVFWTLVGVWTPVRPSTGEVLLHAAGYVVPDCQMQAGFILSHSTPGRGWLSSTAYCTPDLATESGAGSPPPQGHDLGSQFLSRESPSVRYWLFLCPVLCCFFFPCPDTVLCSPSHSFSSFVSLQQGVPPLH